QLVASFGGLTTNDEGHGRFASIEVRVGTHDLDNTHPIRGDTRPTGPRISQVTLPLTDDAQPVRLALWRATDRAYKAATEALTRVKANVASKVKQEDPADDFSHEDPQTYLGAPANYTLDHAMWEGRLRRLSAPFADDPLIIRSDVSLAVSSDNRYFT